MVPVSEISALDGLVSGCLVVSVAVVFPLSVVTGGSLLAVPVSAVVVTGGSLLAMPVSAVVAIGGSLLAVVKTVAGVCGGEVCSCKVDSPTCCSRMAVGSVFELKSTPCTLKLVTSVKQVVLWTCVIGLDPLNCLFL